MAEWTMLRVVSPLACAALLFIAACGGGTAKPTAPPESAVVPAAPALPESAPGLSTVSGKAAAGSVVLLQSDAARARPSPGGHAILDQYSKQFVPAFLLVRVGQPVDFLNSDSEGHNVIVHRRPTGAAVFNTSIDMRGKYTHTFQQAGEYAVTCDIHPGMLATIVAADTPYGTRVDASGGFVFTDVSPGTYTLAVIEGGHTTERQVEVASPRTEIKQDR
jgi:plastocyanin